MLTSIWFSAVCIVLLFVVCAAVSGLNGRFFGGRSVHCQFFPEEKFQKNQLQPEQ